MCNNSYKIVHKLTEPKFSSYYLCFSSKTHITLKQKRSLKNDFQSVLCSLSTLMFIVSHSVECKSILFVANHIPYLWGLSSSFSNSFIDFYSCEIVSSSDEKQRSIKLHIHNGGWHETLNLPHVSSLWNVTFCDVSWNKTKYLNKLSMRSTDWKSSLKKWIMSMQLDENIHVVLK